MDYTKEIISIDDIEANETRIKGQVDGYSVERVHDGGRRFSHYQVIAFDAETRTGVARSIFAGQLFVFRTRSTYATSNMVNASLWEMEDVSLLNGTIRKAPTARALPARVNSDFSWNADRVENVIHRFNR